MIIAEDERLLQVLELTLGDNGYGLLMMDQELAARVFKLPIDVGITVMQSAAP